MEENSTVDLMEKKQREKQRFFRKKKLRRNSMVF